MCALEQPNGPAADLYWLAYLLSGRREESIAAAIEALQSEPPDAPYFSKWMSVWARKVVIAKSLASVRQELDASARRTASSPVERAAILPTDWTSNGNTSKQQLERALLRIEVFPRCALLLLNFEGLSLDDASILLDAGRDLVRKAQRIGLEELTRNLAVLQGWTSDAAHPYVLTGEAQHA